MLFLEGSKGDRLHGGGNGWPQVRGRVSRIASLLLDFDLARMLLLNQGNARIVLRCLLSGLHFKHSEEIGGRGGSAGGPSCLSPLRFFYLKPGLSAVSGPKPGAFSTRLSISKTDYPSRPRE